MRNRSMLHPARWVALLFLSTLSVPVSAELFMPAIFGDSMVVQRNQPIAVWGWTQPGIDVTVTLGDRRATAKSAEDGRFDVKVPSLPAGGPFEMVVQADETRTFKDVLVGEVWVCSGQSNMQWSVGQADDGDLESLSAKFPQIRIISVPQVGTQEPQRDFKGSWSSVTPETVKDFSAVGYFFGRQLHQTLDIPIGLIDNAWGGSAAEAWVPRNVLEQHDQYTSLLAHWDNMMEGYDFEKQLNDWKVKHRAWVAGGRKGNMPQQPRNQSNGNHRPANIYNGVLRPTIGYTIAGVIWYQGESNANRAYQYRDLFPLMIQTWRDQWGQGDFPFYWVQLADYLAEQTGPEESAWAELREAQTLTLSKLPNTGQVVIVDIGEGRDIHPRNKQDVAKRLSRLALKNQYGFDIPANSPSYESMEVSDNAVTLTFKDVAGGLYAFDTTEPIGFTIAGEDKKFVPAQAKLTGKNRIQVTSSQVKKPVAVRYGWANNPVVNVQNRSGLPLTPFRTDDWDGITKDVVK